MNLPHFFQGQPPASVPPPAAAPLYHAGQPLSPPYYGDQQSDAGPLNSLDPLRLLQIVRKKWLTILLAAGFATGAGAFYLSRTESLYQAVATIELSMRRPRILNKSEAQIEDSATMMQFTDTMNTRIEKFKRQAMLPHVVRLYRELYPDDPMKDSELAARLAGGFSFSLMRRTLLVLVSFVSHDRGFPPAPKTGRCPMPPWRGWRSRPRRRRTSWRPPTRSCSMRARSTRWMCWRSSARQSRGRCWASTIP